ncbi:hypothetical protein VitviT2T_019078 [Vitis vinifera]|uniref:Uncharacterized protein n=1 Tax=Vitis vinifera TaxID=29760 RepID=A0ABY9D2G6_VITVI|nr:hypothetical protein VitviT2T_019078 [Vitis vinifera]
MEYNWNANIEIFGRRGPAPVDVIPQGSHGLSSSIYRSNLSGVDETRKRSGDLPKADHLVDVMVLVVVDFTSFVWNCHC